jgi:ParB family chromosome partitioning protein
MNTQQITENEILKTKKTDLLLIDPKNIVVEENFNVRSDYGDIDGLSKSIIEVGQLEPISVSKIRGTEQYVLTDGHRRMKAILKAIEDGFEIQYVKAIVATGNLEDRIFAMVITGIGKKPLNNLEEGEAYKRLKNYGYDVKNIASKVGKSIPHIYNMLKLADMPMRVKNYIINDEISGSTVVNLMKEVKTDDELIGLVENAVLNVEIETEEKEKSGKKISKKKATSRHAGILSPFKKLKKAVEIAKEKEYANAEFLETILKKLEAKESKPENIAKLLR